MDIIQDIPKKAFILPLENDLRTRFNYTLDTSSCLMGLIYSEVPSQLRTLEIGKELVEKIFEKLTEEGYPKGICSNVRRVTNKSDKWSSIIKL